MDEDKRHRRRNAKNREEGTGEIRRRSLTGRLVVDEAAADGEEQVRRDGDAGDEVLVNERLVLQLLVLRRREGRRPRRPPPAHRVLLLLAVVLRVGLPHPAKQSGARRIRYLHTGRPRA